MTGHQEYCLLRFVRLAQCEKNDAIRFPGGLDRHEPGRPRRHDEQKEIRSLRWLREKVMEDQFVDRSIHVRGALEYATDVAFDAGGDETADTVKAQLAKDPRSRAHFAADRYPCRVVIRGALSLRMPWIGARALRPVRRESFNRNVNHTGVDFRRWFFLRSSRSSWLSSLIRVMYCDTVASFVKGRLACASPDCAGIPAITTLCF